MMGMLVFLTMHFNFNMFQKKTLNFIHHLLHLLVTKVKVSMLFLDSKVYEQLVT